MNKRNLSSKIDPTLLQQDLDRGMKIIEISKKYGFKPVTIHQYIRRRGLKKKDKTTDGLVREHILKIAELLGGNTPTINDFEILKNKIGVSLDLYKYIKTHHKELNSYNEFLLYLGVPLPNNPNTLLYGKMLEFGLPFQPEYSIKIDGIVYRLDFCVDLPELGRVWLEIDGASHRSISCRAHQMAKDPEKSFLSLKERDKLKSDYCSKNNMPLVRLEPHYFLGLTKEGFISSCRKGLEGVSFDNYASKFPLLTGNRFKLDIDSGVTEKSLAIKYDVCRETIRRAARRWGLRFQVSKKFIGSCDIDNDIQKGMLYKDIADKYGFRPSSISRFLSERRRRNLQREATIPK